MQRKVGSIGGFISSGSGDGAIGIMPFISRTVFNKWGMVSLTYFIPTIPDHRRRA